MRATTIVARLAAGEPVARRLASYLAESLDPDDVVCAAFEGVDGRWQMELHFRAAPNETAVRALVALAAGDAAGAALTFETVAARDWVAASLAGLPPVFAGRFTVHGGHDRARVPANRIGIEIEAALAFGTGHHGTTRGCLLALDGLARRGKRVKILDLGTGSGVLAIAAAKVFRTRVLASDIDPRAVTAAQANARLNRAGRLVEVIRAAGCGSQRVTKHAPYDLVFANILLGPLQCMAAPLARLMAPDARVVLSGLLPAHANAALAAYRAQGLRLERRIPLDGWVTLVLAR